MQPSPGDTIEGKYRVDAILGHGGMGCVVRATHLIRRAPVALKFLLPAVAEFPGIVERFVNEAVAASALDCENVIKIYDVGEHGQAPYLVMEYLEGEDLDSRLAAGPLEVGLAVHIMLQALWGLHAAHDKGIIHRDLKPANVFLIRREGDPDFVKLLDFGVSKLIDPDRKNVTSTGMGLGTPLYMSPEQARNAKDVDARADIYSAGAILYQMLAGRPPHDGQTITELLSKLLLEQPKPIDEIRVDLPEGLAEVVHRSIEKDPELRFASARAFASSLLPFAEERSIVHVKRFRSLQVDNQLAAIELGETLLSLKSDPLRQSARSATVSSTEAGLAAGSNVGHDTNKPVAWTRLAFAGLIAVAVAAAIAGIATRSSETIEPAAAERSLIPVQPQSNGTSLGATEDEQAPRVTVVEPEPSAQPRASSTPPVGAPKRAPAPAKSATPVASATAAPASSPSSTTPHNPLDIKLK